MDAYSMPITPAPATTMDRGTLSSCRIPSESMIVRSSNATVFGRAGLVPVAMTMLAAVHSRARPFRSQISIEVGLVNRAVPVRIVTRLRVSWLRTTSFSRLTTWWVRAVRSAMVISSLTR